MSKIQSEILSSYCLNAVVLLYHFPKVITSTISLNEKVCRKGIKNIITVRVQGKKDNICLYKKMEGWVDRWINEPVRIVLAVQAGKKTLQ